MYLQERHGELASASLQAHNYRFGQSIRWCDEENIGNLNSISGRQMHEYKLWRRDEGDLSPASVKTQMDTLRVFIRFCERIDAVPDNLHEKIQSPTLSEGENERKVKLENDATDSILDCLSRFHYANREHVIMLLLWRTGIRMGSLRSLDLTDFHAEDQRLELNHEPEENTPLKNKKEGERYVAIKSASVDILENWIE